jgi:phospholipid/cholesterol/gamma-HCH transport system substrate-binding protein
METEKHYFLVGSFIIGFAVAAAFFAIWMVNAGSRDDVRYRIHFAESVSGLNTGSPVKYRGVEVGSVEAIALDPQDMRLVRVEVKLRKGTPVKTDTFATLKLQGITGIIYIELDGGTPQAPDLLAVTPPGQEPEIPAERGVLSTLMDQLPELLKKLTRVADQSMKLVSDKNIALVHKTLNNAEQTTQSIKENPAQLIWGPKKKKTPEEDKSKGLVPDYRPNR